MSPPPAITLHGVKQLLHHPQVSVRLVNIITLYRIITFPILVSLLFTPYGFLFKWLLLASFLTDAIDGYIARKFNATSVLGSSLDSIGDDLTILAAIIGLIVLHVDFLLSEAAIISVLIFLYLAQLIYSLMKYKRLSSFHTYLAKIAAVITSLFLLTLFFFDTIIYSLFYLAAFATLLDLIEEIILVWMLPQWKANVKGVYWVVNDRNHHVT